MNEATVSAVDLGLGSVAAYGSPMWTALETTTTSLRNEPETVLLLDWNGQMLSVRLDAIVSMTIVAAWRTETTTSAVTTGDRSSLEVTTKDGHKHHLDFGSEQAAQIAMMAILGRYEVPPLVEIYPKGSANPTPNVGHSQPKAFEEV